MFGDDEAQMVGNSSEDQDDDWLGNDEDLGVCPLEAGVFGVTGQSRERAETEDSDEILLAEVQRQRSLKLAERCWQEAAKIIQSGSHVGMQEEQRMEG